MNTYIPNIIQETAQGFGSCRVEDQMLANREVMLCGEVNNENVTALTNQLMYLCRQDPGSPVTVYINSPGGSVDEGMTLYDIMQAVAAPIHTVCSGHAYSMAALLVCAGDHRSMLPHSKVMVHEPFNVNASGGDLDQFRARCQDLEQVRRDYCQIMARHTGRTVDEVSEAMHKTTFYNADEAVDFGFCDEIIRKLP